MPREIRGRRRSTRLRINAKKGAEYANQALAEVRAVRLSQRKAADAVGINRGTIQSRLRGHRPIQEFNKGKKLLSDAEEEALKQYILSKEADHEAVTLSEIKASAQMIVDARYACKMPPEVSPKIGGRWVSRFLQRADLQAFWTKGIDAHRVYALTEEKKDRYFALLRRAIADGQHSAETIYAMDETWCYIRHLETRQRKAGRRVQRTSERPNQNAGVVNHEGLTVIFGICANGDVVPPFFIFKASKLMMQSSLWKDQFGPEAPQDAAYHCNNTAYNNFDMMMKWIDHLNKHGKPGRKLLVMDNAGMHISLEARAHFELCGIDVLTLPPHSTDKTQGLDRVIFHPLKDVYSKSIEADIRNRRSVCRENFPQRFMKSVYAVCKPELIRMSFEATGVWPVDESRIHAHNEAIEDVSDTSYVMDNSLEQILENSLESLRETTKSLVSMREKTLQDEIDRLQTENELMKAEFATKLAHFVEAININTRKKQHKESMLFLAWEKKAQKQLEERAKKEAAKAAEKAKKAAQRAALTSKKNDGVAAVQNQSDIIETPLISAASGSRDMGTTAAALEEFSEEDRLRARRYITSLYRAGISIPMDRPIPESA